MKKILVIVLTILVALSISGCNNKELEYAFDSNLHLYVNEAEDKYVVTLQLNVSDKDVMDKLDTEINIENLSKYISDKGEEKQDDFLISLCPNEYIEENGFFNILSVQKVFATEDIEKWLSEATSVKYTITYTDKESGLTKTLRNVEAKVYGIVNNNITNEYVQVPTEIVSYETFFSTEHTYEIVKPTSDGDNTIVYPFSDKDGMGIEVTNYAQGIQDRIVLVNSKFRVYETIGFDGFRMYYFENQHSVVSYNCFGKKEILYIMEEGEQFLGESFLGNEAMFMMTRKDGKYYGFRFNLSDLKYEKVVLEVNDFFNGVVGLEDSDSTNHLKYTSSNAGYVNKVKELVDNPDKLIALYKKYNRPETEEELRNIADENKYGNIDGSLVYREYGLSEVDSCDYDFTTGIITVIP